MHYPYIIKSTHQPLFQRLMGWILCLFILSACGRQTPVVYSEFVSIDEKGIPTDWEYTFSPAPFDSTEMETGRFDVIVLVRYSNRCASKSVILDAESLSLEHSRPDSLRITIPLFDGKDSPRGNGNLGVYEIADTIASGIKIPQGYVISLSSPLPADDTKGIIDIGIKLSRSGQEEFNLYRYLPVKNLFK